MPLKAQALDVVKGSVATAALFLAFISLPVIGLIPGFCVPTPGVYYSLKSGRMTGIAIVLMTVALLVALRDPAALIIYLLQAGVMTLTLPEFLKRNKGGARSIVYAVAVNLAVVLVVAAAFGMITGTDLHAKIIKGVNASINQTGQVYEKMGVKGDELKGLQDSMRQAASLIVTIYPALITVALGCIGAWNVSLVSRIAARFRVPVYIGDFRKYRNPEPMIWLLIVSGFTLLIPQTMVYLTALNTTVILCALYCVQGFAIISHYFSRYRVPRAARAVFIAIIMLQPFLTLVVAALGIFDLWGNFRAPRQPKNL
ncbi:YybS family protein [Geomesophilobacter sediminis]|uniref:YybS family protein n=1 Tax=Geomesophilobacter sediminis TaxID=2798584 RepID=A0A8J7M058_9BACT|nr:YybS family protein [Geomesophilobacter sediminis]MBJ6723462.1 YybS family protein [Geomesophilobacter sediminis]